jgi:hypothetical protein
MDTVKERMSELEGLSLEISQIAMQREEGVKKNLGKLEKV